jgi:hypothetical protein
MVDVQFGPTIERFGMFFLHDLNLSTGVVTVLEKVDCQEVITAMKHAKHKPKQLTQPETSCPNSLYPLGDSPPWADVVSTMATQPELLMMEWFWDEMWASHQRASLLFIQFTVDMWLAVNGTMVQGPLPRPNTLEEAMEHGV